MEKMKLRDKKRQFVSMSKEDLILKLAELRSELFSLRLNSVMKPVSDNSLFKKLRKDIARVSFYLSK
jgi:ribosomal protein L29